MSLGYIDPHGRVRCRMCHEEICVCVDVPRYTVAQIEAWLAHLWSKYGARPQDTRSLIGDKTDGIEAVTRRNNEQTK